MADYTRPLLAHVQIECADFEASCRFFDAVLAPLGAHRMIDMSPHALAYGAQDGPVFWIGGNCPGGSSTLPSHIAFSAGSKDAVEAFVAAGRALGAEVLNEPREWPEYYGGPLVGYYAGFLRDPDGNNIEATFETLDFTKSAEPLHQ